MSYRHLILILFVGNLIASSVYFLEVEKDARISQIPERFLHVFFWQTSHPRHFPAIRSGE